MSEILQNIVNCPKIKLMSRSRNEIFVILYYCNDTLVGNENYDCIGTRDYVQFPDLNTVVMNCKRLNTNSIFLLHNHPYSLGLHTFFLPEYDPTPSIRDISSTRIFSKALSKKGITVEDHIIVTRNNLYFSFKENYLMEEKLYEDRT